MTSQIPDLPEVPERMLLDSPAQFEALNSPVRMRILNAAREPKSVREIAEELGVPVTRLYHHVNILSVGGFIEVVHTRKSGARLEKLYRITGQSISLGPDLAANVTDAPAAAKALAAVIIEPARIETEAALTKRLVADDSTKARLDVGRTVALLTPDEVESIRRTLEKLITDEMASRPDPRPDEAEAYALTYAFLPTDL